MAYKAKQKHTRKYGSDGKEERFFSGLTAKFDFRGEIAPKDRAPVRKRIRELAKDIKCNLSGPIFSMFVDEKEFYPIRYGYVERGFSGLSFRLEYYSFAEIPPRQMPHLSSLNRYILTGEKPPIV